MKTNKTTLLLIAVIVILAAFAFKPAPENKSYEYLTIHSFNNDLDQVYISVAGKTYLNTQLTSQSKGPWDFNPLLNLINKYESEGWELQDFNALKGADNFIWMRKEK